VAPGLEVIEHDVAGPPTSVGVRGAGWVEAAVAVAAATGGEWITAPNGARARAWVDDGVRVQVECGEVLDEVVLRSYCVGAAHMALGWVRNEAIVVNSAGEPLDITVRSMGVLRAVDTPHIDISIIESTADPVNGSDAVFAAVALAAWRAEGLPPRWPTMRS
jgi:hypothetical protein